MSLRPPIQLPPIATLPHLSHAAFWFLRRGCVPRGVVRVADDVVAEDVEAVHYVWHWVSWGEAGGEFGEGALDGLLGEMSIIFLGFCFCLGFVARVGGLGVRMTY